MGLVNRNAISRAVVLAVAMLFSSAVVYAFFFRPTATSTAEVTATLTAKDDHPHDESLGEVESIELSDQARSNLGLELDVLKLGAFVDSIDIPGTIVPSRGRTHIDVTSPMTGVIESIMIRQGEMVESGTSLFGLRMTHQKLVEAQETYLAQLGQLDVEQKEIVRLESITRSGAVAGKTLIARKYERDKISASIRAARQALLLDGLTKSQIDQIERTRELVREVVIKAPELHADDSLHHQSHEKDADGHQHVDIDLLVSELQVNRGQAVQSGQSLARLSDYQTLLIQGHAFERDADILRSAAEADLPLRAVLQSTGSGNDSLTILEDLHIQRVENEIDPASRLFSFYVGIENRITQSETQQGRRYVSWQLKPGQRLTLQVPTAKYENVFTIPKSAIAQSGPDRYVFLNQIGRFEQVPVRILAENSTHVAIENKRPLRSGRRLVIAGAHQLQMAMENRAAGPVDPHAGHSH